jgi:hypothetical protein
MGLLETEVPSSYQVQQCFMTMLFCGISQIMIAYVILMEIKDPILYDVDWYVTFVRFICLSAIHFGSANEYRLQLNTIKYLSFHAENFKYPLRALVSSQLSLFSLLITEVLSIKYIMIQGDTLAVVNNFIKMKILSQFGLFFMEPYKFSSLTRFIGVPISIDRFRKSKVLISRDVLKGADLQLVSKTTKTPAKVNKTTE